MNTEKIIITLFAKDCPGIVRKLSNTVLSHEGNWLESSLSRLCGQCIGIVHIAVADEHRADLIAALENLHAEGINVTLRDDDSAGDGSEVMNALQILIEANDRPGIIGEISGVLEKLQVNVESMDTERESASMAGYPLFRAHMFLALPESLGVHEVENALEKLSDDFMVSVLADDE